MVYACKAYECMCECISTVYAVYNCAFSVENECTVYECAPAALHSPFKRWQVLRHSAAAARCYP
jgi:hypothetical protein